MIDAWITGIVIIVAMLFVLLILLLIHQRRTESSPHRIEQCRNCDQLICQGADGFLIHWHDKRHRCHKGESVAEWRKW